MQVTLLSQQDLLSLELSVLGGGEVGTCLLYTSDAADDYLEV